MRTTNTKTDLKASQKAQRHRKHYPAERSLESKDDLCQRTQLFLTTSHNALGLVGSWLHTAQLIACCLLKTPTTSAGTLI